MKKFDLPMRYIAAIAVAGLMGLGTMTSVSAEEVGCMQTLTQAQEGAPNMPTEIGAKQQSLYEEARENAPVAMVFFEGAWRPVSASAIRFRCEEGECPMGAVEDEGDEWAEEIELMEGQLGLLEQMYMVVDETTCVAKDPVKSAVMAVLKAEEYFEKPIDYADFLENVFLDSKSRSVRRAIRLKLLDIYSDPDLRGKRSSGIYILRRLITMKDPTLHGEEPDIDPLKLKWMEELKALKLGEAKLEAQSQLTKKRWWDDGDTRVKTAPRALSTPTLAPKPVMPKNEYKELKDMVEVE